MKIAVYGSLRTGGGLKDYYFKGGRSLSIERLGGWDMYSLGGYPYVTQGDGEITIEVFDVHPESFVRTAVMEMNAGYQIAEVNTSQGKVPLFWMLKRKQQFTQVKDGDWIKYYDGQRAQIGVRSGRKKA